MAKEIKVVNKNAPIYSFDFKVETEEKGKKDTYRMEVKKPTRTILSEADMFYSIRLSHYIKIGLLTAEQLAKRQVDIGGTFSEDQQRHYAKIQGEMAEKQEMYLKLSAKKELEPDEVDRKKSLYEDIAMLRSQVTDYEYIKNQIYEHTANAKARNDVVLFLALVLAQVGKVAEEGETILAPMFAGESHETRKLKLDEMEDEENKVLAASFSKLAAIITMWYWMGISDKEKLVKLLKMEDE